MSIEYVELTIEDASPIEIEIAAVGEQGPVGPSSVTEAELTAALAAYLPRSGGTMTGPLVMQQVAAGSTMFSVPATDAVFGNFNFTSQTFAGVNVDATDNHVYNLGINVGTNGARLDPTKPMLRLAWENRWKPPGETQFQTEFHISCMGSDAIEHRPWSMMANWDGSTILLSSDFTRWAMSDMAGTPKMLIDLANNNVDLTGLLLRQNTNNVSFLQQRNAANSAFLALPYYDSSNALRCDGSLVAMRLPAGGVRTSVPLIVTNDTGELFVRHSEGTNASRVRVYNTFTSDANFAAMDLSGVAGSNAYVLQSVIAGAGVHRNLQTGFPSIIVQSLATNADSLILRQLASQTNPLLTFRNSSDSIQSSIAADGSKFGIGTNVSTTNLGGTRLDILGTGTSPLVWIQNQTAANNTDILRLNWSNAVVGTVTPIHSQGNSSTSHRIYLQQNGNGRCESHFLVVGTGDPQSLYEVNGVTTWAAGIDNSDSDAYVISRASALGTNNALRADATGVRFYGLVYLGQFTVGTLPSAAANAGAAAYVTNSSVTTYRSIVAGGGSEGVEVLSNGSNWLVS